jgi:hypothetical protein
MTLPVLRSSKNARYTIDIYFTTWQQQEVSYENQHV